MTRCRLCNRRLGPPSIRAGGTVCRRCADCDAPDPELAQLAERLNADGPELADVPFSLTAEPARRRGLQKGLFDR